MGVRFRVDIPKSIEYDFASDYQRELLKAVGDCQDIIVNQAIANIAPHNRTGTARRSITAEPPQRSGNSIVAAVGAGGAGAPYARWLEEGTGLWGPRHARYRIVPVHAKALAWPAPAMGAPGGQFRRLSGELRTSTKRAIASGRIPVSQALIFRRAVMHPGHRPMPFLSTGLADSQVQITDRIDRVVQRWGKT